MRAYKTGDENVVGGNPIPVYKVDDAELVENGGNFKVSGNEAIQFLVYEVTGETPLGGSALPLYIVNDIPPTPNPPTNLTATENGADTIDLAWVDNSTDETGFEIERRNLPGGTFALIHTTVANVVVYADTGLALGGYEYRVRAINGSGASSYSNTAQATLVEWWEAGGAGGAVFAYQPKGATDLTDSYVNLVNPGTNNAAPGVAPTWNVTDGWIFNGTTQFLTTGVTPANNQTWSMLIQFTNGPAVGPRALAGSVTIGTTIFRVLIAATGNVAYSNGGTLVVAPNITAGNLGVAGNRGYRNGIAEGANIVAWGGGAAASIYIGCFNNNGATSSFTNANIQAIVVYNNVLSADQVLAVADRMAQI